MIASILCLLICLLLSVHVLSYTTIEAQEIHDKGLDLAANQRRELEAIPYFQKAYKLDPNNANFINDLSVVYMHTGHYEKSFDVLLRGLKKFPTTDFLQRSMKDLRDNVQRFGKAYLLDVFTSVVKNRDEAFEAHRKGLKLATKDRDFPSALKQFLKAYELYPINLKIINDLAMTYLNLGEHTKSMEILKKGLAISANDRLLLITIKEVKSALAQIEHLKGREAVKELKNITLALPYFEKAFSLAPHNTTYANNLGVAYLTNKRYQESFEMLKLGLAISSTDPVLTRSFEVLQKELKDAGSEASLAVFEKDFKKGKRLCAHLLEDEMKEKNAAQPGMFSSDDYDDDDDDEDDEDDDEDYSPGNSDKDADARFASAKIQPDGSISVSKPASTTKMSKSTSNTGPGVVTADVVREWLGDWLFSDETKAAVRAAFVKKVPYQIQPFLKPDKADALYRSIKRLSDAGKMKLMQGLSPSFQFHHHNVYENQDASFNEDPVLQTLHNVMDSQYVRDWFAEVSDSTINIRTTSTLSYYKPGDYSMLHHDSAQGPHGGWRKVAFVLHMSKEWDPKYGGDLIYINPLQVIHAQFNNMVLFKVAAGESWHIVTPVAEKTPAHMQRLAYSGWWNGPRE